MICKKSTYILLNTLQTVALSIVLPCVTLLVALDIPAEIIKLFSPNFSMGGLLNIFIIVIAVIVGFIPLFINLNQQKNILKKIRPSVTGSDADKK